MEPAAERGEEAVIRLKVLSYEEAMNLTDSDVAIEVWTSAGTKLAVLEETYGEDSAEGTGWKPIAVDK